jgi:ABC-type sugar transport system permease subunit
VMIGSMQIFDEPQILTAGGPANASLSVVQYLYTRGINQVRFGYASTIGVTLFAAIFVLSLIQLRAGRSFRDA